jgi:predicted nucleic-acid-binding Zn-ribbon protein
VEIVLWPKTVEAIVKRRTETMQHANWSCPKCDNVEFETDIFQATGGMLAKIFDVQNKKFTTVTCTRCQYTEIYKGSTSNLGNIFDFFT